MKPIINIMNIAWEKIGVRGALLALWLGAAGLGGYQLIHYAATPSQDIASVNDLRLVRNPLSASGTAYSLVVYLHPGCACSKATLAELRRLLAKQNAPSLAVRLIFVEAKGYPTVKDSDLYKEAAMVPGATVEIDPNGMLAKATGALASGVTFLYDASGKVLFRGGLTAARGHEGGSRGQEAVLNILRFGPGAAPISTPVFGCSLFQPDGRAIHAHR